MTIQRIHLLKVQWDIKTAFSDQLSAVSYWPSAKKQLSVISIQRSAKESMSWYWLKAER